MDPIPPEGLTFETRWSKLQQSGDRKQDAWEFFYQRYRGAVAALFRKLGPPAGQREDEVEDLVQAFFLQALKQELLSQADPSRGRFRGYVKKVATNYLFMLKRKAQAQKRRPPEGVASVDAMAQQVPAPESGPGKAFDRAWGRAILDQARAQLQETLEGSGRGVDYQVFLERADGLPWQEIAAQVGSPEPTLRRRYRKTRDLFAMFIREAVKQTVSTQEELEQELAELQQVFAESA